MARKRPTILELKAAANRIDVYDILDFARDGDADAVAMLQELKERFNWSNTPLHKVDGVDGLTGTWVDVVCIFLSEGHDRIVDLARDDAWFPYCLAVLEFVVTKESIDAIADIADQLPEYSMDTRGKYVDVAAAIHSLLGYRKRPPRSPKAEVRLRNFLHKLLDIRMPQRMKATVVSALGDIGNEESISRIELLPAFTGHWQRVAQLARDEIKKRHRT